MAQSVRIEPPVVIGRGCELGEDVVLEGPAVIGDESVVGAGSHIVRGLVLPRSHVPPGSLVVEGVIGRRLDAAGHDD